MSRYAVWHGRIVWLGIILNMFFVFPLLLVPAWFLGLFNISLDQLIWARASGMLLFIISVFYIPATWDLERYRTLAWLSIFPSRTFGSTFFAAAVFVFGHPVGFLSIAIVDGFIGIITFILLLRVTLEEKKMSSPVAIKQ